jgi:hypothetical protein
VSKELQEGIYQLLAFGRPALFGPIMATGGQDHGMREFAMFEVTACPAKQELIKAA